MPPAGQPSRVPCPDPDHGHGHTQGGHKHEDRGDDLAQHSDLSLTASWGFELLVQRSQLLPQALQLLLVLVQFLILGGTVRGRQRLRRGLGPGRLSRGRSLFFLFGGGDHWADLSSCAAPRSGHLIPSSACRACGS